jgi:hypothetical protein
MSNHRWCCCGEAQDCCDMQNCATFVAPNSITITYTGTLTRTFDTGQVCTLATYTYTIESVGNFTQHGNSCDAPFLTPPRTFRCPNARVSYQYTIWAWQPKDFDVVCPCPPFCSDPTWVYPCSACIPPDETGLVFNMSCDCRPRDANYFKLICKNTYTGTSRVIPGALPAEWPSPAIGCCFTDAIPQAGLRAALTYYCCDVCGCARPTISFTPESTNPVGQPGVVILTGSDTLTEEIIACNPTLGTTTSDGGWSLNWFSIAGDCGCPDAATWANPVWTTNIACQGYAMPSVSTPTLLMPCTNANISGCKGQMTCNGLTQGVCETGKLSFEGICVDQVTGDGTVCSYQFSYSDSLTQTMAVVIT